MSEKVSVIIPTYNRFKYLLNAINSVLNQTYPNIEVIVINDHSSDENYYTHIFDERVKIIHLDATGNSRAVCGFPSVGYVRTIGMKEATGKYIAFLDDDDIWFPDKIRAQLIAMRKTNTKMACCEAVTGKGPYRVTEKYIRYNSEQHFEYLNNKYGGYLIDGFPFLWDLNFIEIHNCIITSSFIVEKELIESIGYMPAIPMGAGKASEDYVCWLELFRTGAICVYINEPYVFYDEGHGASS
jgi:glycosyltransferase involved in cell wall biosynthesis